jgi:hypothetical protein
MPWPYVTLVPHSHSHHLNKLEIHTTYIYTYISPLSLVTHVLTHTLTQTIMHTYITFEQQSSLNMVRCASAILLLGCGVSCPRILRGLIFAFHWYLAWSDIHVLKAAEVHGVHGDYIMIEMIQIGFFLTSVSENPRLLDFALRFLFARVMWGCGTVKLNSDWIESKKVGAITVGHAFPSHWTSQEMPSVLAFIMSKLPGQKVFTLLTLVTELTPPLFIWGSKMQRFTSCVVVSALMLGIITTGT